MASQAAAPAATSSERPVVKASSVLTSTATPNLAAKQWVRGDYKTSLEALEQERAVAAQKGDRQGEASALISKAKVLETLSPAGPAAAASPAGSTYPQAIEAYRKASEVGNDTQRALAQNNMGTLYLRSGNVAEAVRTLGSIDFSKLDQAQRSIYLFNYGRALEQNHDYASAYKQYTTVLASNPQFAPAVNGAFRSLLAFPAPQVSTTSSLAIQLLEKGVTAGIGNNLHACMRQWAQNPDAPSGLVPPLLQYFVATGLDWAGFQQTELPFWERLAASSEAWRAPLAELQSAYAASLKVPDQPYRARELFPFHAGNRDRAAAFSRLLKMTGDQRSRTGDDMQALARYYLAWGLDRDNAEALVYLAAILHDDPKLDPNRALLNRLIDQVFTAKGEAYANKDYLNVLRLHTLLGTIFENDNQLGPPYSPRSAVFQWEHALQAADILRKQNPDFPPYPALYLHLASVYQRMGRTRDAGPYFLSSAEGFVRLQDFEQAKKTMQQFDSLPLDAALSQRARQVRAALAGH
jgi:tetratricopeptide (TPR) repeat protein